MWNQEEVPAYIVSARIYFSFFVLAYTLHFVLVDLPLKKEPIELWAQYRFGCAGLSAIGLALTFSRRLMNSRYSRVPLALSGLVFGIMQAQSMIWRLEVPYFYAVVLPVVAAIALRTSVFGTVLYLCVAYVFEKGGWTARPQEIPYLISASIVSIILSAVVRSRMSSDVRAFLSEQSKMESMKQVVEKELELAEQIRAFLPKVIYERFDSYMKDGRRTVVQAIDEVLRGRRAMVACLYSDIRDFTRRSKAAGRFIQDSVIPNMRACTDVVEQYQGVPRLIGDLIFAYFDDKIPVDNVRRAVQCAIAILEKNEELNVGVDKDDEVTRYVVVSFGEAVVGNTGGSEGSREITAIGRPSNLSARVDSLTKDPNFQRSLENHRIILTSDAAEVLLAYSADFDFERVGLAEAGLKIKDFPEETQLFLFPRTKKNLDLLERDGSYLRLVTAA